MTLASSRTLPGQECDLSSWIASGVNSFLVGARGGPEAAIEVLGQVRNIVDPQPQRRQVDLERVDAVHQIFAEVAVFDHLGQVAVRGADHPHVDLTGLVVADPPDLAAFQHAQQLGLHRFGQFADLVQEDASRRGRPRTGPRGVRRRR